MKTINQGSCGDVICGHQAGFHAQGPCAWPGCKCTDFMVVLTPREYEILMGMARGNNVKEVAFELKIAPKTVAAHCYNLFQKTGAHSQLELILSAIQCHLIRMEDLPHFKVRISPIGSYSGKLRVLGLHTSALQTA